MATSEVRLPVPDPSTLTTEQMLRENAWLRSLGEAKDEVIKTRLDAMDKGIVLLQAFADKSPTTSNVALQVVALDTLFTSLLVKDKEITNEKFSSVATQFTQNATAVAAALQAQEKQAIATNDSNNKAIAKMEDNFTKLLDQVHVQINDIKSRLDKGEGTNRGVDRSTDRSSVVVGQIIAGAVAFVVVMTAIVGAVAFVVTRPNNTPIAAYAPTPPVVR